MNKHRLKNELLKLESIFEILMNEEDSPFPKSQLLEDGLNTIAYLTDELKAMTKEE